MMNIVSQAILIAMGVAAIAVFMAVAAVCVWGIWLLFREWRDEHDH